MKNFYSSQPYLKGLLWYGEFADQVMLFVIFCYVSDCNNYMICTGDVAMDESCSDKDLQAMKLVQSSMLFVLPSAVFTSKKNSSFRLHSGIKVGMRRKFFVQIFIMCHLAQQLTRTD